MNKKRRNGADFQRYDYFCTKNRREYVEKVVTIETAHHNGEISERILRYANLIY